MSIQETIFWGVVSGALASMLLQMCIQFFYKIILPWYKVTVYEGLIVEGAWKEVQKFEAATDISKLVLKQSAHALNGTMTVIKQYSNDNATEIKTFDLQGHFRDGHIVLYGKNTNRSSRGHIVYLLEVKGGGTRLHGIMSWVDANCDAIAATNTIMLRESEA